jgi:PAS domain S-box-containing protein
MTGRPGRRRAALRGEYAEVRELARVLREIVDAHRLTAREFERRTQYGHTALSENLKGVKRPTWQFVTELLRACAAGDAAAVAGLQDRVQPLWEAAAPDRVRRPSVSVPEQRDPAVPQITEQNAATSELAATRAAVGQLLQLAARLMDVAQDLSGQVDGLAATMDGLSVARDRPPGTLAARSGAVPKDLPRIPPLALSGGQSGAVLAARDPDAIAERYEALLRGAGQIIWVASPDGDMAEDCAEWRQISGQQAEEFRRDGWLGCVHPDDRYRVEAAWRECLEAARPFEALARMRTADGAYRHYEVRADPVVRHGAISEWVGACTDITSQREAEEIRGRLTEQLSAAALRTARLQQATSMLAEALTVRHIAQAISQVGQTVVGALRSSIALYDSETLELRVFDTDGLASAGPGMDGPRLALDIPCVITQAIGTGLPFFAGDPGDLRAQFNGVTDPEPGRREDELAWAALPLLGSGWPLGALRFAFGQRRTITEDDRTFLVAIAEQCARAVERATLYERDHVTAEALLRSMLPVPLPSTQGMRIAARYVSAARGEIGADWYDAFSIDDGRTAVAVGDVSGRGLNAVAAASRLCNALRTLSLITALPDMVLDGLDRVFAAAESDDHIATVAIGLIEGSGKLVHFASAGHVPPLLLRPGSHPVLVPLPPTVPLGCEAESRWQNSITIPPGGTLVLFTNGLISGRALDHDERAEQLLEVAAALPADAAHDPAEILDWLISRMLADRARDDDVAAIAVTRLSS